MSIENKLIERSESKCELCSATGELTVYKVSPPKESIDECILICNTCSDNINNPEKANINHWRCLNDSMWSQIPVVQVMIWRLLSRMRSEGWPADLLDMIYLDEDTLKWAQETDSDESQDDVIKHLDCNGTILVAGDTVVLTKDLNVKGAGFTAKRGTSVRNISLVHDNSEQIEGRVSGQQIVILTKFVKKSS